MSEFLTGKRALVTGASKGIGLAVARALRCAGARVVICARGSKALDQALAELHKGDGGEVAGRTADVSNSD